ncbi:MAG: transketolase [Thermoanaerobacteraceae bacterium]|nr:transketolase [Thermoanaerobacteraceae bacterium]
METQELKDICKTIRKDILTMIYEAGSGHPGGSLSAVELMTVLYFGGFLRHDPQNPKWEDRDIFILSKGHACPVVYAVLAERGFYPKEYLSTLRRFQSPLQGHPNMHKLPGLESSSGSLGQGLSISNGLAMAYKMDGKPNHVYCLLGDGELDEGSVWEAAMTAAQHMLDNLTAIVDYNRVQLDGPIDEIKELSPMKEKWLSFGWNAIEIDGHNIDQIKGAYEKAGTTKGKPSVIIAHTVKGKGVSFMENKADWHGKAPNDEEYMAAIKEIEEGEI